MFPIKYIENNLVFNHDGECFAYYELIPYNYSFLSPEEKYMVSQKGRNTITENGRHWRGADAVFLHSSRDRKNLIYMV